MKKIILALDVNDKHFALDIVDRFSGEIDVFKVGLELFCSAGPDVVREINDRGKKVFLDLKYHDIPNTVLSAAKAAVRMGVYMFNVHTSGGLDMMRRCREEVATMCLKENIDKPKILGVTVLTSLGDEALKDELCLPHGTRTHVKYMAKLALKAGLDGVVASGHEASMIKEQCGNKFMIVTPGIRPSWTPPDDQRRTMTPKDAIRQGADFLVIGRSILKQDEPEKALELINLETLSI